MTDRLRLTSRDRETDAAGLIGTAIGIKIGVAERRVESHGFTPSASRICMDDIDERSVVFSQASPGVQTVETWISRIKGWKT